MALSKNAYIAVLCLAFLYSVFMSYLNVLQEPTTFEEYVDHKAASLPSITFCNRQWFEDEFETFEDIMDARLLRSAAQRALRSERRSQKWERERERRSLKKMGARARAAL